MQIIKGLNQLIYFLLEQCMFFSLGYTGFRSTSHPYGKYISAIGLPLIAIILWSIFAAPRFPYRLESPYRSLFALTLFGLTAILLYRIGYTHLAIAFGVIALVSELIALVLKPQ